MNLHAFLLAGFILSFTANVRVDGYHKSAEISENQSYWYFDECDYFNEWMDVWDVLIEIKSKRSYTVSLYEEETPLAKSHDSNDVIVLDGISLGQALRVFWRA